MDGARLPRQAALDGELGADRNCPRRAQSRPQALGLVLAGYRATPSAGYHCIACIINHLVLTFAVVKVKNSRSTMCAEQMPGTCGFSVCDVIKRGGGVVMPTRLVETRGALLKRLSGFATDKEMDTSGEQSQVFSRWLGEVLLLVYFALGICTAYAFKSGLAFFSSGVLFAAVVIVVYLRWSHGTRDEVEVNDARFEESEEEPVTPRVWSKSHECEHEIVDTQHRDLYSAFHALCDAVGEKQAERFNALLRHFVEKLRVHFTAEEAVLHRCNPSIAIAHAQEHELVLSRAVSLSDDYQQGRLTRAAVTNCLMNEVLVSHIEAERRAIRRAFWE